MLHFGSPASRSIEIRTLQGEDWLLIDGAHVATRMNGRILQFDADRTRWYELPHNATDYGFFVKLFAGDSLSDRIVETLYRRAVGSEAKSGSSARESGPTLIAVPTTVVSTPAQREAGDLRIEVDLLPKMFTLQMVGPAVRVQAFRYGDNVFVYAANPHTLVVGALFSPRDRGWGIDMDTWLEGEATIRTALGKGWVTRTPKQNAERLLGQMS